MNVLIAPDKFKGTLDAHAVARAIARGWRKIRPADSITLLPITDGGDGFGEIMSRLHKVEVQKTRTVDAADRPLSAQWWFDPETKTAFVESARIIGLALLPPGKFHPFELDTFGVGAVLKAMTAKQVRRCVVGIGGSATNDGGFGLARAMGWKFIDEEGKAMVQWTELRRLKDLAAPKKRRFFDMLQVAVDVRNPLLGSKGATRVYGPQKGIRPQDFELAEECLGRLARVTETFFGKRFDKERGTGAAGGLGFGLRVFLGASLEPGFGLFANEAGLDEELQKADLVLTGEGAIDASTFMGKGVGEVARLCRRRKIPCFALVGHCERKTQKQFAQILRLTDITSREQALKRAGYWLERLAERAARSGRW